MKRRSPSHHVILKHGSKLYENEHNRILRSGKSLIYGLCEGLLPYSLIAFSYQTAAAAIQSAAASLCRRVRSQAPAWSGSDEKRFVRLCMADVQRLRICRKVDVKRRIFPLYNLPNKNIIPVFLYQKGAASSWAFCRSAVRICRRAAGMRPTSCLSPRRIRRSSVVRHGGHFPRA